MDAMKNQLGFRLPRLKLPPTMLSLIGPFLWLVCALRASAQVEPDFDVRPVDTFYENELQCRGEWKHPADCSNFSCDYKASWEYRDEDDQIIFTISTKNRNKWTGIGFSENQAMPETDAILGLVEESGRFFLMDSWLQAYEAPPLDPIQNLYNQTAWRENGITTLKFSRPRQTGDSRDYQFSDTNCPYFIFPVMGGVFNAVNKRIRKHESTPVVSDRRICVRSCRAPTTTTTTTTTTSTTTAAPTTANFDLNEVHSSSNESTMAADEATRIYRVELKLFNFLTATTKQVNSEEYQDLLSTLEESLYKEIKPHFDRVRRVEVSEVISDDKNIGGNARAILDLTVGQKSKEERDETQALTVAINSVIQDRTIGQFSVDPKYLVIGRRDGKLATWISNTFGSFSRFTEDEQKWIIIGAGISALVLLAIIQALCMFCRCRSNPSNQQEDYLDEKDHADKQWKEYTHDPYSGAAYNGYGGDEFGYNNGAATMASKSSSLHKNYRNGQQQQHDRAQYRDYNGEYHGHGSGQFHQSLDRRHYEQQQHSHHSRRNQHGPYEMNDRHHGPAGGGKFAHQMQPDYYFMPHQRKYSSDVVRVFVDYDAN